MLALPAFLIAAAASLGTPEPEPTAVLNGEVAERCAWPGVVAATEPTDICSGVLVHPELILFAAHCDAGPQTVWFAERDGSTRARELDAECSVHPQYRQASDSHVDVGFCRLAEPVRDLPIYPVARGCEDQQVQNGAEVAIVGFGWDEVAGGGQGTKRWGMSTIQNVAARTIDLRGSTGGNPSACPGDSGGPALMKFADGGWRVVGIASAGLSQQCGGTVRYARMAPLVDWVESESGIDITPCFDDSGNWQPTPRCGGFATEGPTGSGQWEDWCEGTPRSGDGATCGAAFDRSLDAAPPTVSITAPADGAMFASGGFTGPINVTAADPDRFGIAHVELEIDGARQPVRDAVEPFEFDGLAFPDGAFELVAIATDLSGNEGRSEAVTIVLGEVSGSGSGSEDGADGGVDAAGAATGGEGDGGTSVGASDAGAGEGCGCRGGRAPREGRGAAWMWLGALGVVRRRARP